MTLERRWLFPLLVAGALGVSATPAAAADTPSNPTPPPPAAPAPLPRPAWLGVSMDNGGDTGVRVEHVVRSSPADKGGMKSGDRIVAVDGVRVTSPGQVSRGVAAHKVGESMTLGVERTGNAITATVVLAGRPSTDEMMKMDLVGAPAPAWGKVTPLGSAPASIGALRGRVVLVDFWATWCGPCKLIAPRLSALKDRLGVQGLSIVGITNDEAEPATAFADKYQMRYPIVIDKDSESNRAYGVSALPTMVLVDKNGIVRDVFIGFDPGGDAALEASVRKLLAEAGPAATPVVPTPAVPRPEGR